MRLIKLPPWNLTNKLPAFHDVESATAVQMTSKLYEYMKMFQTDYEKFVEEINKAIDEYNTEMNTDQKCFEEKITKIIHDYIHIIDTKLAHQDREIEEAIVYIKENLEAGITSILEQMKESGELDTAVTNAFDELGTRVTELELDYTEVMETLGAANQNIYDNETRIVSLEDRANSLEGSKTALEGDVTSLENKTIALEDRTTALEERATNIESNVVVKGDIAKVRITNLFNGEFITDEELGATTASLNVNYPEGFNKENSYVVSTKLGAINADSYSVMIEQNLTDSEYQVFVVGLYDEYINVCYYNSYVRENPVTAVIDIVLMKI